MDNYIINNYFYIFCFSYLCLKPLFQSKVLIAWCLQELVWSCVSVFVHHFTTCTKQLIGQTSTVHHTRTETLLGMGYRNVSVGISRKGVAIHVVVSIEGPSVLYYGTGILGCIRDGYVYTHDG